MSEIRRTLPNREGLYKPGRLATYLGDPANVDGYLIWHREAPAGFAFVSGLSDELRKMGDFFVVRAARRQGVGNDVGRGALRPLPRAAGRSGSRGTTAASRSSGAGSRPLPWGRTGRRSGGPCRTSRTSPTTISSCSRSTEAAPDVHELGAHLRRRLLVQGLRGRVGAHPRADRGALARRLDPARRGVWHRQASRAVARVVRGERARSRPAAARDREGSPRRRRVASGRHDRVLARSAVRRRHVPVQLDRLRRHGRAPRRRDRRAWRRISTPAAC